MKPVVFAALTIATSAAGLALAPSASAAEEPPARVSGLSNFWDYCDTGNTVAVPLLYQIGSSTANLVLAQAPPSFAAVKDPVYAAEAVPPQMFDAGKPYAKEFINAGRTASAPLAAYNEQFNSGLTMMAEGTRAAAKALGPVVQPADVSMNQFAEYLDALKQK
jgi:hypothetical protein